MLTILKTIVRRSVAFSLMLMLVSQSLGAATNLNLVFLTNTNDPEYDAALVFKNHVESYTNGSVTVNIFPGAQLCGGPIECFELMKAGVVDVYTATASGTAVLYPAIQVLEIPYMLDNDRITEKVLTDGKLVNDIRQRVLKATNNQILLLAMSNTGGWRNFATVNREIKSPADIKGLKLRTTESEIQQRLVRAMGGSPTPLPFMEVYTALQTGVIDGTQNSLSDITNMKFEERLKYITFDGHTYMANMWFIGNTKFNTLTPAEQQVILDGATLMSMVQFGLQPRKEIDVFAQWKKAGGKIYILNEEEKAAFRQAALPVKEWFLASFGDEGRTLLNEVENAIQRANVELATERQQVIRQ